jgi:hypothetical protein
MKLADFKNKINKHIQQKTFFSTAYCAFVFRIDEWFIAKWLSFDKYYSLHKKLGFPVEKLRFRQVHGYFPNHRNPKSFNEKCNFMKLYSRNPILPNITDKVKVREYVAKKVGKHILIPVLQIVDRPEEINFEKLPDRFVIKTNFSSGQNIIVNDKSQINIKKIIDKLTLWIDMKYRIKELIWFAQDIKRKIIIEEFLVDAKHNLPPDYKFYVFNGSIAFIQIIENRSQKRTLSHYTKDWEYIDFRKGKGTLSNSNVSPPETLSKMINIAEILGKEFDFMRVDLYSVNNKVYFGELTPYPGNALSPFSPVEYDLIYGNLWEMDTRFFMK